MNKNKAKKADPAVARKKVDIPSQIPPPVLNHDSDKASSDTTPLSATDTEALEMEHEQKYIRALEANYKEMLESAKELEHCLNFIDRESNEWKTRYENQIEINRGILAQSKLVEKTLEELKNRFKNQKSLLSVPKEGVEKLNEEKKRVGDELADYKWRLEQEDKVSPFQRLVF